MKTHGKNLKADERRAITIQTVVELAGEVNPSEITTMAIAKRMGLTQGAIFRHFSTKDEIFTSVMEWVAVELLSRISESTKDVGAASADIALESMFMTHIDFVIEYPGIPRMLFGELQRAENSPTKKIVQKLIGSYRKKIALLIEDGIAAGHFDSKLDIDAAATLFIGTIQGLIMQSLIAGDVSDIRRNAARVFAIYKRGIVNY